MNFLKKVLDKYVIVESALEYVLRKKHNIYIYIYIYKYRIYYLKFLLKILKFADVCY